MSDFRDGLLNRPPPPEPAPRRLGSAGGLPPSLLAAAEEWNRNDSPEMRQYAAHQAAMVRDPNYASIGTAPSRGRRLLDNLRHRLPRMVGDTFGSGMAGTVSGATRVAQALLPGEQPRLAALEGYTRDQIPESGVGILSDIPRAVGLLGSLGSEFTIAGDVADMARVPGHLGRGEWDSAGLSSLAAVPLVGTPAAGLLKARRGARAATEAAGVAQEVQRATSDMSRSELQVVLKEKGLPATGTNDALRELVDELPMDEASRMARAAEQDWTTNAFHGTSVRLGPSWRTSQNTGDLERFHWGSHFGTQKAANDRLSDLRPPVRNQYGERSFDSRLIKPEVGERIMPVKLRGKYLDIGNESKWDPEGLLETARRRGLITADELEHAFDNVPLLREAELGPNYNKHKHNEEVGIAMKQAVTDLFRRKGFAGVSYKNDVEDAGSISYMVFDPANIRSSMAAAFDPAQAESVSLVAGGAGLLGAGLARNQRERE